MIQTVEHESVSGKTITHGCHFRMSSGAKACALLLAVAMVTPILASAPAQALSCMPPDIRASYKNWSGSDTRFVIVRGKLSPIDKLPMRREVSQFPDNPEKNLPPVNYSFSGINIQKQGNVKFDVNVMVEPQCLGSWCGTYPLPAGMVITAFEQLADGRFVLRTGPCPGDFFSGNMAELEQSVRNCIKGVACKPNSGFNKTMRGSSTTIKIR